MNWMKQSRIRKIIYLMVLPTLLSLITVSLSWSIGESSLEEVRLVFTIVLLFIILPFLAISFQILINASEFTPKLEIYYFLIIEYGIAAFGQLGIVFILLPSYPIAEWIVNLNILIILILFTLMVVYIIIKRKEILNQELSFYEGLIRQNFSSVINKNQPIRSVTWKWVERNTKSLGRIKFLQKITEHWLRAIIKIILFMSFIVLLLRATNIIEFLDVSQLVIGFAVILITISLFRLWFVRDLDQLLLIHDFKEEFILYPKGLSIPPLLQPYCQLLNAKKYMTRQNIPILFSQIVKIELQKNKPLSISTNDERRYLFYDLLNNHGLHFNITPAEEKEFKNIFTVIKRELTRKGTIKQITLTESDLA